MKTHQSFSSEETKKLGEEFARKVAKNETRKGAKGPFIVALIGELGSGKTTFTQGFARGLGLRQKTVSPTFIIMKKFTLKNKNFRNFFHIDIYRLKNPKEILNLGFKEVVKNPQNIVLIEWADKIREMLPQSAIKIFFKHKGKENERIIKVIK